MKESFTDAIVAIKGEVKMEDKKIKLAEFIWNLPLRLGFSRYSRFQRITLWLGDKIIFRKTCNRI